MLDSVMMMQKDAKFSTRNGLMNEFMGERLLEGMD